MHRALGTDYWGKIFAKGSLKLRINHPEILAKVLNNADLPVVIKYCFLSIHATNMAKNNKKQ